MTCTAENSGFTFCGNGYTEHPNDNGQDEQCDDNNMMTGDGCDNSCQTEGTTFCGDTIIQRPNDNGEDEECEDGNSIDGDGCSSVCQNEIAGFTFCGDGFTQNPNSNGQPEQCDDDNVVDGDGCDRNCQREGSHTFCGDNDEQWPNDNGQNEVCDDGNSMDGDGCSRTCQDETGHHTYCPDGHVQHPNDNGLTEVCDDGNSDNDDFCTTHCAAGVVSVERFTVENVSFSTIDFYGIPEVRQYFGLPEIPLTITVSPSIIPGMTYIIGTNSLRVVPNLGYIGWQIVDVTLTDGTKIATMRMNLSVSDVPNFAVQPQDTKLLIAKGQSIGGYYEDPLIGDVTLWGPYVITVKVWERK
jgi:cysteine-rich repeat protein